MSVRPDREAAKRRIMFVAGEDFYFLAYTLFVLLNELGATSPDRSLVDSRKLSYLADFLSSDSDLSLAVTTAPLSASSRSRLLLLYDRAVARRGAVTRLLDALSMRSFIDVSRVNETDRVHLLSADRVSTLLANSTYASEEERLKKLRRKIPHLRTMTLATLKQRLFGDRGVRTWAD